MVKETIRIIVVNFKTSVEKIVNIFSEYFVFIVNCLIIIL